LELGTVGRRPGVESYEDEGGNYKQGKDYSKKSEGPSVREAGH
jgi:hypothetical protein